MIDYFKYLLFLIITLNIYSNMIQLYYNVYSFYELPISLTKKTMKNVIVRRYI